MRELSKAVQQNKNQTQANTNQIKKNTTELNAPVLQPSPSRSSGPLTPTEEIDQLAEQYDQLRNQQAGYVRTLKMTDIANQMVSMASRSDLAQAPNFLSSEKASDRLKVASILIAYPEPKFLGDLISALEREVASEKPQHFLEYWEILAIGKNIPPQQPVSDRDVKRLNKLLDAVNDPYDQSRYKELDKIIKRFPNSND